MFTAKEILEEFVDQAKLGTPRSLYRGVDFSFATQTRRPRAHTYPRTLLSPRFETSSCPLCGGSREHRPGVRLPVHLGTCDRHWPARVTFHKSTKPRGGTREAS